MVEGLNTRFDNYDSMIQNMHAFIPSVVGMEEVEGNDKIEEITHEYRDDLPTPGNAFEEYSRWERRWKTVPKENQPDSVAKSLKVCDLDLYPGILVWASMGQNRLSASALMHINLDVNNDAKHVLKIFCKRDKALEFTNICASKKHNIIP